MTRMEKLQARRDAAPTWAELKARIEAAGVKDDDPVYGIDLGPYPHKITVLRVRNLKTGAITPGVEIEDNSSGLMARPGDLY